jgi:uncharacterized protein
MVRAALYCYKVTSALRFYNHGDVLHSPRACRTKSKTLHVIKYSSSPIRSDTTGNNITSPPGNKPDIIAATKKWVDLIVIGEKLCPFIEPLKLSNTIRYVLSNASDIEKAVEDVATEAKLLLKEHCTLRPDLKDEATDGLLIHQPKQKDSKHELREATLLIFHGPFVKEFNDFDILCEKVYHHVFIEMKFFDILSVMNFHPNHISYFDKRPKGIDDSFFYPRRSPFPTILLVPQCDMETALQTDDIDDLADKNKIKFVKQGLKVCETRLASCYDLDTTGSQN